MALPATLALTGGLCMPCKKREEEAADRKVFTYVAPRLDFDLPTAEAMPFFDLCDRVWDAVVKASNASNFSTEDCEYTESAFSNLLEEHWRTTYAIHAMEYDVFASGFETFFANHQSVLNESVLTGFGLIGAREQQAIFEEAIANQDDVSALSQLDGRYYEASGNARERLAQYIVANFERFVPGDNQ